MPTIASFNLFRKRRICI